VALRAAVDETVGFAWAVPVSAGALMSGSGCVTGIAGAEESGWIGMGEVFGASSTGVAFTWGVASGSAGGAWSHAASIIARQKGSNRFITAPRS